MILSQDDINDVLNSTKALLTAIVADEEIFNLQAKQAKKAHDAYVAEGFTSDQAVKLVSASLRKV